MLRREALSLWVVVLTAVFASHAASQQRPADLDRFTGVYSAPRGRVIFIQPWPGGEGKLLYNEQAGELRALSPSSGNVFSAGPGLLVANPVEFEISFTEQSGRIGGFVRAPASGASKSALKFKAKRLLAYTHEPVKFQSGAVTLSGALHMPTGRGPYAAAVLIHGSGNTDRNNVLPVAHFLVTHGVALLAYDKRGVGQSGGDWKTASLQDFAADALAGVEYLRTRSDIDPQRIGIIGVSQGGWLVPLVASKSPVVAFAISVSGPALSPAALEEQRLAADLRRRGKGADDIDAALALLRAGYDIARGRETWEGYQELLAKAQSQPWFRFLSVPLTKDSWLLEHWRILPLDYDPAPAIAKITAPVLLFSGALDRIVLPDQNAAAWRAALERGGNNDFFIRSFGSANHMMMKARTGADDELRSLQRFVPEFQPAILQWLREHRVVSR